MKKWIFAFLAFGALSFANEKEVRGQELCTFTTDVFDVLTEESRAMDQEKLDTSYATFAKRFHKYEKDPNPEIAQIAEKFITSFQSGEKAGGDIGNAVSDLGRLLKCSVDNENYRYDTSFLLHKGDIQKELSYMEANLGERVPQSKDLNFHKLMIESLADHQYDLALYSYLKIAETRCYNP